jgi:NAD(P)-dependent dehydrogenase (short-subunit alcohol dehydrogenase family)
VTGRLQGKVAVVTAAAHGIGRASAELFAAEGGTVHAVDIDAAALGQLSGCATHEANLTDAEAVAALPARIGPVDVLFNCAGFVHSGTILECDEAAWEFSNALNVTTMYRMIRAFLPQMLDRGGGSIINMSSIASSVKGIPGRFAYGTTKAAVIGLTKSVAADFVACGIAAMRSARARSTPLRCSSDCATPAITRVHARPSPHASRWAASARPRRSPPSPFILALTNPPSRQARSTSSMAGGSIEEGI